MTSADENISKKSVFVLILSASGGKKIGRSLFNTATDLIVLLLLPNYCNLKTVNGIGNIVVNVVVD